MRGECVRQVLRAASIAVASLRYVVPVVLACQTTLFTFAPPLCAADHGAPATIPGLGRNAGRGGSGTTHGNGRIIATLPDGTLRELCTAFTRVTESPFVAADGKWSTSLGLATGAWAKLDTIESRSAGFGDASVSRGLPGRCDVAASLDSWSTLDLTSGPIAGKTRPSGFGGGAVKLRHTFFGVDSAGAAMGISATVRLPAATRSPRPTTSEALVAVPFSLSGPFDVTIGAMTQLGWIADANGTGHHRQWINSIALERDLVPHVSMWLEGVSVHDQELLHPWLGGLNGGLSVEAGSHVEFSVGAATSRSAGTTDHGIFGAVGIHS